MLNFEELKNNKENKKEKRRINNVRINNSNYVKLKKLSEKQKISIIKLVNYMISQCLKEVDI